MSPPSPQIKLFTNPLSPWSHRVSIVLDELQLPYEKEIIDLSKPRDADYLKINPRGQIPAITYDGKTLTESTVIATFLADTYSKSSLLAASTDPKGPLQRAKITFFVDTYFSKVAGVFMKSQKVNGEQREAVLNEFVDVVAKELEPLLADASPFFGGSSDITLAEALTGPFVVRAHLLPKHGLFPESHHNDLAAKAPNFYKWAEAVYKHPSINGGIFDEQNMAAFFKTKMA